MTKKSFAGAGSIDIWANSEFGLGCASVVVGNYPWCAKPAVLNTPEGEIVAVVSGRLGNRHELRGYLRDQGHQVSSLRDDELVIQGYLEWGHRLPEYLDGVFAISIWDGRQHALFMARDRLGVEPLFYYPTSDGILFGSIPECIFENKLARREVGLPGLRELFGNLVPPGKRFWKNVYEVEPGARVFVNRGEIFEEKYWVLQSASHTDNRADTVERVRELLYANVESQFTDGSPCVLLSGGLDSSALVGLLASCMEKQSFAPSTFSLLFSGDSKELVDALYVDDVVEMYSAVHSNVTQSPKVLSDPQLRRATIAARGVPGTWGSADVSLYLAFKSARQNFTEILTGDTADAIFGCDPSIAERLGTRDTRPWVSKEINDYWSKVLKPEVRAELNIRKFALDQYAHAVEGLQYLNNEDRIEREMRKYTFLEITRVARLLIDRVDRMSRAAGIRVGLPYANYRLAEYVFNVPWSEKIFDGREKSLLRHAVKDLVPDSVYSRTKRVYPDVESQKYDEYILLQANEILLDRSSKVFEYVDREWLKSAIKDSDSTSTQGWGGAIGRVLDLYHWFDIYNPNVVLED